ncbi:MAG: lipopolysaccharide heptosyltransferase II [Candidatus Omnitrophica bacterium]|nr:lipopolysaccharide heptosyltransferase II [Candidatus Omnitrophota bacterium]
MNILQIVPELSSGGVERGTVDFARVLCRDGHKSVVISSGGSLVPALVEAGVIHYTLKVHKKSLFSILFEAQTVARIIRSEAIDIVHARSRVPAWIAWIACRKARVPLVTTCHGVYGTHAFSRVMGWGKLVIAISHAVSRHMKERFGVPHQRIRLIHRGVNLAEFTAHDEAAAAAPDDGANSGDVIRAATRKREVVVGIVGRITPIKGHKVMIKAMARTLRTFRNAKLWIIGQASRQRYLEELQLLCQKLRIESSVEFMGTQPKIPELLRKMDLLVAPAVGEEAFGRVLIEAGACGVPVIASRIGGIVDVIEHGKDGMLVTAGDPAALAEAMIGILSDPESASRLAANMKRKVKTEFVDSLMFEKTLEVYREAVEVKKILVIKLSALGDVILSTPSLRAIRKAYPKAHLSVVVERASRIILKECPYIDELFVIERAGGWGTWKNAMRMGKFLAEEGVDIVVDFQNNRLSHYLAMASGAHTRIGFATRKFDFFLNERLKGADRDEGPVTQQFRLLERLGIKPTDERLEFWTAPEDRSSVERFLKENWIGHEQILVGIHPGSSPHWKTKQWPLELYADLCDRLSHKNIRVVLTGTKADLELTERIRRLCRSKPVVAAGKTTFGELAALIQRCEAVVGSDSAPMHVAAAVGTPFVALFGPTDPRRHVAASGTPHEILWNQISCSPCYLRKCPLSLQCLKEIKPETVCDRVFGLLGSRAKCTR